MGGMWIPLVSNSICWEILWNFCLCDGNDKGNVCRYAERDFEKLEEVQRQLLTLRKEESFVEVSDVKVQQNVKTGLKSTAEAVDNSAPANGNGSQAIPPTDVNIPL